MRPSQWRTPLAVTASASILATLLLPGPAMAAESGDAVPTIVDVSPRAVATTDFISENDAVTVTATGFLPGEEVRLVVASTPRGIEAIHDRKRARADGTVTFSLGGSPGRPTNSYSGSYQTEITSGQSMDEGHLSESFSVLPVAPTTGSNTGASTGGSSTSAGSIGYRATNGIRVPSTPGFSVIGVGLSLLALVFTSAAAAVVAQRSQKSRAND